MLTAAQYQYLRELLMRHLTNQFPPGNDRKWHRVDSVGREYHATLPAYFVTCDKLREMGAY